MKAKILSLLAALGIAASAMAADVPLYPGGEKAMNEFIGKTVVYPDAALQFGVEGVVSLSVTINADGSVGAVKVVRMVDPDLEGAAIAAVKKMPKWTPAQIDGVAVAKEVLIKVPFTLPE